MTSSLRTRIAVSVTAVMLVLILGQALALVKLYEEMEQDFIEGILAEQLAYSIERARVAPELAMPRTPNMTLFRLVPGELPPAAMPPVLGTLSIGNHELSQDEREFHVAVREADGARYILRYDESEHEARVRAVSTAVILGALILSLLVLALVYAIAGRLTRGLEVLASRVVRGRGETPFAQPEMEQELLAVARALDSADERQREMLARERNFSANLSHELRTPLAAIRSDAEMLADTGQLPESVHRRAARIVSATDRITHLAHTLLLLAREASPQSRETILLAEAVRAAWNSIQPSGTTPLPLTLEIAEDAAVQADPALLHLVLRNLLENARLHGEGRQASARLANTRLDICDRGPGLGGGEPMRIFDRFERHSDKPGHGLGLALVRHICSACGWSVHAANRPGGGAIVGVDFGTLETG